MPRLAPILALLVFTTLPAAAAPSCTDTSARELAACVAKATKALRRCTSRGGALCRSDATATAAAEQLAEKVRARCDATALAAGGHPAPFEPAVLAARLRQTCLGNAAALVARAVDTAAGVDDARCADLLAASAAKVAVGALRQRASCVRAGDRCKTDRVEKRLAALETRAARKPRKRCGDTTAGQAVAAAARAQTTCALADALPDTGVCAPTGADALVDLWRLAVARPPGAVAAQVSSYDRSGGNLDFGIGPDTARFLAVLGLPPTFVLDHSHLARDGERYVIFDEVGPGVVWRIWMTGLDALLDGALAGDIAFHFDDEPVPRLQLAREELFSGTRAPFLAPLAGNSAVSSGGFFAMTPLPFARRLRITTSNAPNWVQVSFTRLPPTQAVASFDPALDVAPVATALAQAGDPATTRTPTSTAETALSVPAGETQALWSASGPGTVVRLELVAPAGADVPVGLRLRATFDGAATPQIDAQLDELFGASLGAGARSLAYGRDGDRYYCYFPMPFASAATLELRNDGPTAVTGWTARIGRVDVLPPGPLRHLHARGTSASPAVDGRDYVLADVSGTGHVVGVVLTSGCGMAGACQLPTLPGADGTHLEGDERITIDGSRWPQIHGTGLEDFFDGGFYYVRGAFTLPTHGNPAQAPMTSPRRPGLNLRSSYRVLLGDAIPFASHLRLAFEHGGENDAPAEMSSVVYYYGTPTPALAESDRLVLGDAASEAAHALTASGRTDVVVDSRFRGDDSNVAVQASGITADVTRFELAVDPGNRGVRLRRLTDIAESGQRARVAVDGAFAGVWQTSEVNTMLRWAEVALELPETLTAGKSRLAIEIDATGSPVPWRAFDYAASSHLP